MAKSTSPVEEEECSVAAAAGGIRGGEFGKDVDDELKSTRAEVDEAREENERLKKVLTGIVKDYEALQMHLFDIVVQQQPPAARTPPERRRPNVDIEEPELVSLRLGTTTIKTHEVVHNKDNEKRVSKDEDEDEDEDDHDHGGLTLGLDVGKFESSSHTATTIKPPPSLSSEEAKEGDRAGEPWPPSKNSRSADEQLKPQAHHVKRARVSVRARCDTPTMNDGGQWRKYGQKVSKGNPCPRAYYRCTGAPTCPVRKQVQRCAGDMSILTTTYEGTHNHPLPISATAMASATSAAASMLPSGSSAPRASFSTSASAYPHGLNYSSGQFYLQSQLISPSSNSHPTITLDLTNNNKYNSTPSTWTHSSLSQAYWQRALPPPAPNSLPTGTIARAVASDSSFQSALAAAIASYVGAAGARTEIANAIERGSCE